MNIEKESVSLIAVSPFIKYFTRAVISSIQDKKGIHPEQKEVIQADLVPRISKKTIETSIMRKPIPVKPINFPQINLIQKQIIIPQTIPQILPPITKKEIYKTKEVKQAEIINGYGKIDSLINDQTVSVIECPGPSKPIVIIRIGQREFTKIVLNNDEILDVLEEVSNRARIPLMEGVFRAAVDNFLINAIITEMVGSKFVITKNIEHIIR